MTGNSKSKFRSPFKVIILIFGLGLALLWYFTRTNSIAVTVWKVERGPVEVTVANTKAGSVRAHQRARLSPSIGGVVSAIYFKEGDQVKEGDVLVEIWNLDRKAKVNLAKQHLLQVEAQAAEICLRAAHKERKFKREKELRQSGVVSEGSYDTAESEAATSKAACQAAHASVCENQSALKLAEAELDRTIIRAPFEGVIAEVEVEVGEYITPSPPGIITPPAIDLVSTGPVYIEAPIDEVDVTKVSLKQSVKVTLDAYQEKEFQGHVRRIAPYILEIEKQARTATIEVELSDIKSNPLFLPGLTADVEIKIEQRENCLRIPTEAILDGNKVYTLSNNRIVLKEIQTGCQNWDFTEVISGLSETELLVLSLENKDLQDGISAHVENISNESQGQEP